MKRNKKNKDKRLLEIKNMRAKIKNRRAGRDQPIEIE